jgi:hypothetical protein
MIHDVAMQEKHERALAEAADEYERATEAAKQASARLADTMRAAYADGEQQSAILRASKHVWSREYLRVILGLAKKKGAGAE